MENRKLFLLLSLVAILTFSLAACDGGGSSSGGGSSKKDAAVAFLEEDYIDASAGEINIKDIQDASEMFSNVDSPYCIAFEDQDGNAYMTLVYLSGDSWKSEGLTRIPDADCARMLGN